MTLTCLVRKKIVPATPEERVRQACLIWMVEKLGYPLSVLVVEKGIKDLPHLKGQELTLLDRRLDILVYPQGKPLLLIECKATKIEDEAFRQLLGYRHWIGCPYITLISKTHIKTYFDHAGALHMQEGMPHYHDLIK